jgi:uncharacterized membrane protein
MQVNRRASSRSGTGRVQAFSDGVFAISITLLVLDLTVPAHKQGGLWDALLAHWPSYVAFAASFLYVGALWLNHHALFRRVAKVDITFQWLNLALLFGTVLIPFPTALIASTFNSATSDDQDQRVAVAVYSLLAALMSLTWLGVWIYLSRHSELLTEDTDPGWAHHQLSRPIVGIALFSVGGVAGLTVSPIIGVIAIAAMIAYHTATSEGFQRRSRSD